MRGSRVAGRHWICILGALVLVLPILAVAPVAFAAPVTIHPGTLGKDQNGNPLQLHGLGIVKVGSTWYGFGEDKVGENQGEWIAKLQEALTSVQQVRSEGPGFGQV